MKYFYDTEFREDGKTIDLISIGIVAEDGREYYAVNNDCNWSRIRQDDWLMENVVPHLPTVESLVDIDSYVTLLDRTSEFVKPKWVIANEVRAFLTYGMGDIELWAYYAAYDHVALCQLWGRMVDLPERIPMWTRDLMELVNVDPTLPSRVGRGVGDNEHNALADARWNRALYDVAQFDAAVKAKKK